MSVCLSVCLLDSPNQAYVHARFLADKEIEDREDINKFHEALKTVLAQRVLKPPHCSVQTEALF